MMVVVTDGEITYITKNGSTLPTNPAATYEGTNIYHAVLQEGIYSISSYKHLYHSNTEGYAAAWVENGNNVPVFRNSMSTTGNAIQIHAAGTSPVSAWSTGCITIYMQDYSEFGYAAGFLKDAPDVSNCYMYNDLYSELAYRTHADTSFSGQLVVDRSVLEANIIRDYGSDSDLLRYYLGE